MKKTLLSLALFLFIAATMRAQLATNVVISEFATRGASSAFDEFIELYNPTVDDVDISNWKLQYKSSSGSSWQDYVTIAAPSVIKAHGYYLLSNNSYTGAIVSDTKWGANGIADNGHIRIVDATNNEMDKVGYGTAIDAKITPAPNHGTASNNQSVERKASVSSTAASLAAGGAEEKAGNGFNSNNNAADFVAQTVGRNPQNGTSPVEPKSADGMGTAYCVQKTVKGAVQANLTFVFKPSPSDPVVGMKIVIPQGFSWTRNQWDVYYDPNMTATMTLSNDSIFFSNVSIVGDSVSIRISNLVTPAATGLSTFKFFTRGIVRLIEIQTSPTVLVLGPPISIFEARENDQSGVPKKLGQYATVTGIVTVANQFGGPSYMQDASAGVAIFNSAFSQAVAIGDEVLLTGKVDQFNGLTELIDVILHAKVSTGNIVQPKLLQINDIVYDGTGGIEMHEAELVRINGVTVNTNVWTVNGSGTNYRLNNGADFLDVRVDNNVDFANAPAPSSVFDVVGVISQFKSSTPYIGAYQLMPRFKSDIVTTGPRILTYPIESNITATGLTVSWTTEATSSSFVRYGTTTAFELGVRGQNDLTQTHSVALAGLAPATVYYVRAFSVANGDTSFAPVLICITSSLASTGKMNVYFNKSVDASLSSGTPAQGGVNLTAKLLSRLAAATSSIDACVYSLSGTPGNDIATALLDAKQRGVAVRVICESDNANTAPLNRLKSNGVLINDAYDAVNAGAGLMHNKFWIIDGRDRINDKNDWVVTGSWNPTDDGTNNDAQNVIEIQDQALAVVYTMEFDEMWGSASETPNQSASRFGARKQDNTPHRVKINGVSLEVYFSPTDRTTSRMNDAFTRANSSINFAVLTFTRSDLATTLKNKRVGSFKVRGVMDNNSDTGTQFGFLQSNGVDVLLKPSSFSGMLHHKYAVIDAEKNDATSCVFTGSHNWSNAAETSNNENTIFIYDPIVANQYLQEFGKRYADAGGKDKITVGVHEVSQPSSVVIRNYPNPFSNRTTITLSTSLVQGKQTEQSASLKIYDLLGREVLDLTREARENDGVTIHRSQLPGAGVYFYRLVTAEATQVRAMVLTR